MKYLILLLLSINLIAQDAPSGYTANLNLNLYNAGARGIAEGLNANWSAIDAAWGVHADSITNLRTAINARMPKSGGAFTGNVSFNSSSTFYGNTVFTGTGYTLLNQNSSTTQGTLFRTGTLGNDLLLFNYAGFSNIDTIATRRYLRSEYVPKSGGTFTGQTQFGAAAYFSDDAYFDGVVEFGGDAVFNGTVTGITSLNYIRNIVTDYENNYNDSGSAELDYRMYSLLVPNDIPVELNMIKGKFYKRSNDDSLFVYLEARYSDPNGSDSFNYKQVTFSISTLGAVSQTITSQTFEQYTYAADISGLPNGLHEFSIELRGRTVPMTMTDPIYLYGRNIVIDIKSTTN